MLDIRAVSCYCYAWVCLRTPAVFSYGRTRTGCIEAAEREDTTHDQGLDFTGQDTTGIIARVATKLSELNINILDITQTILSGCFTMMMVVDLDGAQMEFAAVDEAFQPIREEMHLNIHLQRMDIFDAMHRI